MDEPKTDACIICDTACTRQCSRCKSARYCSAECQKSDWPLHKLLCATFAAFDRSARPSPHHLVAILFPVDDQKPQVIWIHGPWDRYGYQNVKFEPILDDAGYHEQFQYNRVLNRELPNNIAIAYRDNFLYDGSKTNQSVGRLTSTRSKKSCAWRGPILAHGRVGREEDPPEGRDLDMNDFRHIADYFVSYPYVSEEEPWTHDASTINGIRINCVGDEKMFARPHLEAVPVFSIDPIFSEHYSPDIAKLIGLPLYTRRFTRDPKWTNDEKHEKFEGQSASVNQDATFLHLCCDPNSKFDPRKNTASWGWAASQWQNNACSIVVVRQDQKPLYASHVEALAGYCRFEVLDLLHRAIGEEAEVNPISKDSILALICRAGFAAYWDNFVKEQRGAGRIINDPSPYDV